MSSVEVLREGSGPPSANTPRAAEGDASATDQLLPPSLVVWAVRIGALTLLGCIVGYLVNLVITDDVPAQFRFELDWPAVENRRGNYVLPIEVVNDSTEAVNEVVVRAELDGPGDNDETVEYTIALMGEGEVADAELLFTQRPTEANTTFRVLSYQSP